MNTTPTTPRAALPPARFGALTPDPVEDAVFLLGLLYLELGLAPEAAFRAALADYDCAQERSVGCRL